MSFSARILLVSETIQVDGSIFTAIQDAFPRYQFILVGDCENFERLVASDDFNLLITDARLSWGDGLQIFSRFKEHAKESPVILRTCQDDDEIARRAIQFGVDEVIPESPYALTLLLSVIKKQLARDRQWRGLSAALQGYQSLFENIPIGMYRTAPDGRILEANSMMAEILGYPDRDILLGADTTQLYVDPQDRDRWRNMVEKQGVIRNVVLRLRRQDGGQIWVRDNGRAVYDADGRVQYYEGSLEDITATVASEEKLRFQAQLLDNVREAFFAVDLEGTIIYWSKGAEALYGFSMVEVTGQPVSSFIEPRNLAEERSRARQVQEVGSWRGQYLQRRKEGAFFWVDTFISLIRDGKGEPYGLIGMDRDITEIKRLHDADRKQRELSEILRETGAVLNSTLDFDILLDRLLVQVTRVVPCDLGIILMVDGNQATIVRMYGYEWSDSAQVVTKYVGQNYDIDQMANWAWMVHNKEPLLIPDVKNYSNWIELKGFEYIRSWVGAPVVAQDQTIALFSLDKNVPGFFQSEHLKNLAVFSSQVALAMQNAHLFARTMEALDREKQLNAVAHIISGTLDLANLLPEVLRLAAELVNADAGGLALVMEDGQTISSPYLYNLPSKLQKVSMSKGESVSWQVVATGESILLPEYQEHSQAHPDWVATGVHGFLGVPVMFGDACLGALGLFSLSPEKVFNQRDLVLAETIGRQAGVAIQNAHLFVDLQAQKDEAETLRQATSAVSSALELDQVLDRILNQLAHVLPYDSAAIFLITGANQMRIVSCRGFPKNEDVIGLTIPADDPLIRDANKNGAPLILKDAREEPLFNGYGDTDDVHGWMLVPLLARGQVIGYLTIDSYKTGAYNEAHAALAQVFANQAAIAIENARLYQSALKAADRSLILHRASQEIGASLNLEQLYEAIHSAAAQLMPSEAFVITILNELQQEIDVVYLTDHKGRAPLVSTPADRGLSGQLLATGKSIYIEDFLEGVGFETFKYGDEEEVRSILAVPLKRQDGKVFGMLSAQSYQPHAYSVDDQTMLELLAAHAATAIDNARLFGEVQRLAITDPLTGLYNRRHFLEAAQIEFERSRRYNRPLSLMMLDLDEFKEINDTFGHLTGDQVLIRIAARSRDTLRGIDILGRFGGDEMVVLMPETELETAYQVAERLRKNLCEPAIHVADLFLKMSASIGIVAADSDCPDLKALLARADQALYISKNNGRNQTSIWMRQNQEKAP